MVVILAVTGVLTFHWADDYGALLQAFALKRCLENLGARTEVIPYAPFRLVGRYWWCPLSVIPLPDGGVKYRPNRFAWKHNLLLGIDFWKRRQAMRSFRRRYLSARLPVRTAKRLSLEPYDCVFVGRDQVWNPDITVILDDAYIGNVGRRGNCRLVAYAASMGRSELPERDREKFVRCVNENFYAVSLREPSAVPFVESLLCRGVTDMADPVFLLNREEWERLRLLPPERDYVLLHWTEYNEDMRQYAGTLARLLHKKVIQTSAPARNGMAGGELHITGGPAEFIGYIRNAACVVTNSFHAAAFSILFERQFLVFGHSTYNARLSGMLKRLELGGRLWEESRPPEPDRIWDEIDWEAVRKRLETERGRSFRFMRSGLEKGGG